MTWQGGEGDGETVYIGEASIIKESSDVSENRLSEKLGLHARPSPLWQGQLIVLFVTLILAPDFDLGHLFLPRIFIWTLILAPVYIWDTYSGTNFHLGHLFLPQFTFGTLILAPCFSVVVVAMRICIGHTLQLLFFPRVARVLPSRFHVEFLLKILSLILPKNFWFSED